MSDDSHDTTKYRDTIDWDDYWTDPSDADRAAASPSAHLLLDPFRDLLDAWGVPDSYADVGCGTGTTVFDVADVERALRNLYAAVEPGGSLVFTYHNRMGRAHYRTVAEDPHEHLGEDSPFDPESYGERFQLLVDGENLLSHDRIEATLGTRPRSVWSVVGDEHRYAAWRHNLFVFVPK